MARYEAGAGAEGEAFGATADDGGDGGPGAIDAALAADLDAWDEKFLARGEG